MKFIASPSRWWPLAIWGAALGCSPFVGSQSTLDVADARADGADASDASVDDIISACPRLFRLTTIVKAGPEPVFPVQGGRVRMAHAPRADGAPSPCAGSIEGSTDADGSVTLSLRGEEDDAMTVTAWAPEYTAVSIVGLTASPVGYLRLDPLNGGASPTHLIAGSVTGSRGTNQVMVDAYDFQSTVADASNHFNTTFQESVSALPLQLDALEIEDGRAVNLALGRSLLPRPSVSVAGYELAFPTPPRRRITTTVTLDLRFAAGIRASRLEVARSHEASDTAKIYVGTASVLGVGGQQTWVIDSFPAFAPTEAYASFDGVTVADRKRHRLNVVLHEFTDGMIELQVPRPLGTPSLLSGRSLSDAVLGVPRSDGWDVLQIAIGESRSSNATWRIFCLPAFMSACRIPSLPSAAEPADLGIGAATTTLLMLIKMRAGAPWSLRSYSAPFPAYDFTFAGDLVALDG